MKTLSLLFVVLLIILALLAAGLQIFLTKGLTSALNDRIFPAVETLYGLEMSITNASINLLKGKAELQGFQTLNIRNYEEPFLFTADQCLLEVEVMSLIKREPIVIKRVEASGATLTVERNPERKINMKELIDALKPIESSTKPGSSKKPDLTPAKNAAEAIPVHIRRIAIDANVNYVDTKQDRRFPLNLRLTGTDIFTSPQEGQEPSLIVLRGSLAHNDEAVVTDLNAIIDPLTNPAAPTFNATGSILDIDADFIEELLSKNDMESGPFSIKPSISCTQGRLDGSYLDLIINDLKIFGTDIGDTTLTIPVSGTLTDREYDITGALQSLFSKQSKNILKAAALKELGIQPAETSSKTIMAGITNQVEEIADSPKLQELLADVIPGASSSTQTNQTSLGEKVTDALFEQLEQNVDEVNEGNTDALKGLFKSLLGD